MNRNAQQNKATRAVTADSVGALVPALLRQTDSWQAVQVYRHCAYFLDRHSNLLCLGDERIDKGPYTVNCAGIAPLLGKELHGNCRSTAARLIWPELAIDIRLAERWTATFAAAPPAAPFFSRNLDALAAEAADQAPSEGYGTMIPEILGIEPWPRKSGSTFLHNHLRKALAILAKEAHVGLDPETLAASLTPLIGVGHGLTPSGDDFCAGVVIGLAAMGRTDTAARLAQALHRIARERTTVVSLAGYRALAYSQLSESQACLLSCFAGIDHDKSIAAVRRVARIGGTSGWDTLAGFACGLATAAPDACRQHRAGLVETC
jgi:hypothetical protein